MDQVLLPPAPRSPAGGYKVAPSRGGHNGRVSSSGFRGRAISASYRCPSYTRRFAVGPTEARPEPSKARSSASRRSATTPRACNLYCLALRRRSRRRIGASANWPRWSAHRRHICANYRRRLPASTSNTAFPIIAQNRSRRSKPTMVASNCGRSPGPTMVAYTTMNWSPPCNVSRATASVTPDGRCPAF